MTESGIAVHGAAIGSSINLATVVLECGKVHPEMLENMDA
jgi:hypothetical protein